MTPPPMPPKIASIDDPDPGVVAVVGWPSGQEGAVERIRRRRDQVDDEEAPECGRQVIQDRVPEAFHVICSVRSAVRLGTPRVCGSRAGGSLGAVIAS